MAPRVRAIAVAVALAAAALVLPSSAAAQVWTCEASAWAGTVLTSPRQAPVTANAGQPACRTAAAGPSAPALPLPLAASGMSAETRFDGAQQTAFAAGGVTDLRVRSLPALPIQLPQPNFDALPPVVVPQVGTLDLRPALQALVPGRQLPEVDLVRVQDARAEVTGRCVGGAPQLTSAASVARLTVNGVDMATERDGTRDVTLIDTQSIDPSDVDLSKVLGPVGVDLTLFQGLIQPVLDGLPDIAVPATVARVAVTPGRRTDAGGRLTQTALQVAATIAGQNVADLTLGEATVGASQVSCPGGGSVADLALACTTRRLVLIDVLRRGDRVRLLGAAARSLAGRRVAIRFTATGRTVARPRIGADGLFRASAPLPRAALRRTNRARYEAVLGSERSLRLKLSRRMVVTGTRASGGNVTIAGRVLGPLGRPARDVVVERRLSCGRFEVVRRFRPRRDGRFTVRVPGPEGSQAAVFRLRTQVRRNARSRSLFPTFTLPRFVDLS